MQSMFQATKSSISRAKLSLPVVTILIFLATALLSLQPVNAFAATVPVKTVTRAVTFEKGIVYPRYQPWSYGIDDLVWQGSLPTIRTQTASQWIEMPVLFEQPKSSSTTVVTGQSTASVESFLAGVRAAHAQGLHVFLVPLMAVRETGGWAGTINFTNNQQKQAWFDSYWKTFQPYVQAAADNGVEQIAIGTELKLMEQSGTPAMWNQLISRIRTVYKNSLTYDMNFSSLDSPVPSWMLNANLKMLGVSSYFQLASNAKRVDPKSMPALWLNGAQKRLDLLSTKLGGKPVLISEIGYRNSSDTLYQPWAGTTKATADPQEQAGAFDAALAGIKTDPHIGGIFVWGWDDVHLLSIKGLPAVQTMYKWYTQPY